MKILCVCDQGNNRSVVLAHHLKYLGHDVIPVGTKTNSPETLQVLGGWADKIIYTEVGQTIGNAGGKSELWNIGPDNYPRPFNRELMQIVRKLIEQHKAEL